MYMAFGISIISHLQADIWSISCLAADILNFWLPVTTRGVIYTYIYTCIYYSDIF